jgi:hypothetical protein
MQQEKMEKEAEANRLKEEEQARLIRVKEEYEANKKVIADKQSRIKKRYELWLKS